MQISHIYELLNCVHILHGGLIPDPLKVASMAIAGAKIQHVSQAHCDEAVCGELLCFEKNKTKVLAFDDLICVCEDFYSVSEVEMLRNVLRKYVSSDKRLPKRSGSDGDQIKKLLADQVKVELVRR